MSQDFTTTLGRQLRAAAEREARRGRIRLPRLPERRSLVLAAVGVAVLVAVAAVVTLPSPRTATPARTAPHVIARVAIADHGGELTSGFGALWTYDAVKGDVLRLSPDGTVAARIPVSGNLVGGEAGAGAMWAMTDSRLYRIDPATNRVVARIPLPPPSRSFALNVDSGSVWIYDTNRILRVDPATNRFGRAVSVQHDGLASRGIATGPGALYVLRSDGRLETRDARDGRVLGVVRPAAAGEPVAVAGDEFLLADATGITALDPGTGAVRWSTALGRVNCVAYGAGAVWVQATPPDGRDHVFKLDPKTGRVLGTLALADFGATGMTTAGGALWIASPDGNLTEIR